MKKLYSLFSYWAIILFLLFGAIIFFVFRDFVSDIVLDGKLEELRVDMLAVNNLLKEGLVVGGGSEELSGDLGGDLHSLHRLMSYEHLLVLRRSDAFLYYGDKGVGGLPSDYSSMYQIDELIYDRDMLMARDRGFGYDIRYYVSHRVLGGDSEKFLFYAMKFDDYYIRFGFSFSVIEATINRIDILLLFIYLLLFILFFASNLYFARLITRPLVGLKDFVERFRFRKKDSLSFSKVEEIALLQGSLIGVSRELKKQFSELSRRRRQVETVIKHVSEGVLILDGDLKITIINRGVYRLLDIKREVYSGGLEGRYYYEIIKDNEIISLIEQSSLENKKLKKEIHSYSLGDRVLELSVTPLPKGVPGSVIFIDDITEGNKVRKLRSEFVDNVSHELQNPISLIKENVLVLSKGMDSGDTVGVEALSRVMFSINLVSNFIRDLVILHKLDETNKDYFRKNLFSVDRVIDDCIESMSDKARDNGIELSSLIEDKDIELRGNRELAEIIFSNLIDNAINYTKKGGVVSLSKLSESNGSLVFLVTDTGIGIPVGEREKVFDRFYSVSKSFSQRLGGTGLGLSIVRSAVLFHYGGDVVCYDNPSGRGSEFRISFPSPDSSLF